MTGDAAAKARTLTLVFTDLADSTALKTERGDQAVGELIARHRAHVRRLADNTGGRIIDWAGDGCFLTFEISSAAVLFALRLQRAHGDEPDLPGVRTGIHMGEVTERPSPEGDAAHPRVEGLAVDLAARITGLARPGQVLMSAAVSDSAQSRLGPSPFDQPIVWRMYGTYALKGFDKAVEITEVGIEGIAPLEAPTASEKATPIAPAAAKDTARAPRARRRARTAVVLAIGVVLVTAGGLWRSWPAPLGWLLDIAGLSRLPVNPPLPDKPSIVVLPFVNLSGDPEQEYLAESTRLIGHPLNFRDESQADSGGSAK